VPNAKDMTTAAVAGGRVGVSSSDATLQALITAASSALAQYLGYTAQRREGVQETAPARGGRYLWLESGAIQSVTSISVGGTTVDASLYALDGEDGKRKGRLVARGTYSWPFTGTWTGGISSSPYSAHDTGTVLVTFTSGWKTPGQVALTTYVSSDMPEELEQACLEVVTAWWARNGQDAGITSISTGDASVGWGGDSLQGGRMPLPLSARLLAAPYRKRKEAR
jgi:hypothetical protein